MGLTLAIDSYQGGIGRTNQIIYLFVRLIGIEPDGREKAMASQLQVTSRQ